MGRLAGIFWILLASLSFAIMGAATKVAVPVEGTLPVVFWRSVVVVAVSVGLIRLGGFSLRPGNWKLLLWRSFVGLMAMICFFWSLGRIPLGTANTLLYTSPLFTVLLAGVLLGEERRKWTLVLAAVAFAGVALVMRPSAMALDLGVGAALAAGFLAALAYIAVRKLRTSDPPARIVAWFSIFAGVVSLPFVLTTPLPDTPMRWVWLLAVGVFAAGGQLAMTQAYRVEQAHVVGPFSYATVVFSYALGLAFWDEEISLEAGMGVSLVVGAGALLSAGAKASDPNEADPPDPEAATDPDRDGPASSRSRSS